MEHEADLLNGDYVDFARTNFAILEVLVEAWDNKKTPLAAYSSSLILSALECEPLLSGDEKDLDPALHFPNRGPDLF